MKKILSFSLFAIVFLIATSCSVDEANETDFLQESNDSFLKQLSKNDGEKGKRPQPLIWVDCTLYSGIVVPATFEHGNGNFDELYAMDGTFLDGAPLISDSKPGDRDYNGGRWHLNVLNEDVDPSKYEYFCSDNFDPGDFDSTDDYFECPLRPINNQ